MVSRITLSPNCELYDVSSQEAIQGSYDLGVWAAGYESRSSWLVESQYRPSTVRNWRRVEFVEHGRTPTAIKAKQTSLGTVFGGRPGRQNHDGYWLQAWLEEIRTARRGRRGADIFLDITSMPRSFYGPLVVHVLRGTLAGVRSITIAYVRGETYGEPRARCVEGLRGVLGTEGLSSHNSSAFIIGVGFDGATAAAVVELFQVSAYACLVAANLNEPETLARVLEANERVLLQAQYVARVPTVSVGDAYQALSDVVDWYRGYHDLILLPLGPKPHVIAALSLCALDRELSFRFPRVTQSFPIDVTPHRGEPYFARFNFG